MTINSTVCEVARVAHDGWLVCEGFDAHARDKLGMGTTSSSDQTRMRSAQDPEGCRMQVPFCCEPSPLPHFWFSFLVGSNLPSDYGNAVFS
jgi:hypothetical protein